MREERCELIARGERGALCGTQCLSRRGAFNLKADTASVKHRLLLIRQLPAFEHESLTAVILP